MVARYTPDKGDIVWLNFSPQEGHEQAGNRPALILSPESYNRSSKLMIACPITTKVKEYPFEVRIKTNKINGVILADQIKSLDWNARKVEFADRAPYEVVEKTKELIQSLLED